MQIIHDILKKTMDNIVKKIVDDPLKDLSKFVSRNKWPASYSKSNVIRACNYMINETLPHDPSAQLLDALLWQKRTPVKLDDNQKNHIHKVIELVSKCKTTDCAHLNLGIAAFLSGGGFFPVCASPEVICLDCGLNVTIYNPRDYKRFSKEFGLIGGKKVFEELSKWAHEGMKSKKLTWVDNVPNDPLGEYHKCQHKWTKPIPFKIKDKQAFESQSGIDT